MHRSASPRHLALQLIPLPRRQKMLVARDITEIARVEAMQTRFRRQRLT
jgi:hypothetical protein